LRILLIFAVVVVVLYGLMAVTKSWTPRLGLDLSGGTTVTLTARNSSGKGSVDPSSLQQARTIIQQRVDGLGVGEAQVTTSGGDQVIVSAPNVKRDQLVRQVGQTAKLRFRLVYAEQNAPQTAGSSNKSGKSGKKAGPGAKATNGSGASTKPKAKHETAKHKSAKHKSKDAKSSQGRGSGQPAPQLPTEPPAPPDNKPSKPLPTAPGKGTSPSKALNWKPNATQQKDFQSFACPANRKRFPDVSDQPLYACSKNNKTKYLLGPMVISGTKVTKANAGIGQQGVGGWQVNLSFDSQGSKQFEKATGAIAGKQPPQNQFAIVLDGRVISAPSVSEAIPGGRAEISGSGIHQKSAQSLANVLKYGSLPLAFDVSSVDTVSPTLGGQQLQAGLIAGAVGMALVMLYCLAYYRGLGLVVMASLAVAFGTTYAAMVLLGSSVGFALSLAGIAGAIVAIGITGDSFVIYFARIRDEVGEGRTVRTAVETGWRRAKKTVLIADAVSLLSALILFILAIGSVRGFAFTLGLTTLIDVFVIFGFTKPIVSLLSRRKFFAEGHRFSGFDASHLGVSSLPSGRRQGTGSRRTGTERTSTKGGEA
jgi:preprotein translocase subunit SecD